MSLFDAYGAPQFGLDDAKIAVWNSLNSFGAAVDVPSVQLLSPNLQTVSANLEGDDKITASHAVGTSAQVRLRFGSINLAAMAVLTGVASVESDVATTRKKTLTIGNITFPYFAICGRALASEGSGDTHIFLPKVKIMEGFSFTMEYGRFTVPELTCMAVKDGNLHGILEIVEHETAMAVTIPPVTT